MKRYIRAAETQDDFKIMLRQYKHRRDFNNADDAELSDLLADLKNKGVAHDVYQHKTGGGCTIFYDDVDYSSCVNSSKHINSATFIYPWKMAGEYADGFDIEVGGFDEDDCMGKLIDLQEKHGELVWYSGVNDEDYGDGEYIGRDNFIYD